MGRAKNVLKQAETVALEAEVRAPADGVILHRIAEPGLLLSAGQPALTMAFADRLYVRTFIPEPLLGKVRSGMAATVHVDSFPGRSFPARVTEISPDAEFTPQARRDQERAGQPRLFREGRPRPRLEGAAGAGPARGGDRRDRVGRQTVIVARSLVRKFGAATALKGVDLSIDRGEMFGLIGPDGAGKSTFFRIVAGLLAPTSGSLERDPAVTFGFVPQRFAMYEDLSVDENLSLRARLYDVPREEARRRAADLLGRVGLEGVGGRLAGALSGGMKQKLALVAALLTRPDLLLLDEPTTGVDPVSRREFWSLLNELHHQGLTILVSTPYMDEAEYASRIGFLDEGRLTALGTRDEILAAYPRPLLLVRSSDRVHVRERLARLLEVDDVSLFGTQLHVRGAAGSGPKLLAAVRDALAGLVESSAIEPLAPTLEDVFVLQSEEDPGRMSATARSGAFLEVRKLTRRFGDFTAVDAVDFDVPRGKVFGFLGPNGSGKSTTIRMLAGLLEPTSGSVTGFGGLDVALDTEQWKARLGYMSQKFSLYLDLSVDENLRFFGTLYGLSLARIESRVGELSQRLGFGPTRSAMTAGLSTGQRQRVALAAALLHEPELLFLDEPTGGVDPKGRRLFWDLIYELAAERGMTVLVTTHYMDEAEQCDRLAFILNGRIIADGPPHDLKNDLRGRIFEVDPAADADPFEELSRVKGDACARGRVPVRPAPAGGGAVGSGVRRAKPRRAARGARLPPNPRSRTCSCRSRGSSRPPRKEPAV